MRAIKTRIMMLSMIVLITGLSAGLVQGQIVTSPQDNPQGPARKGIAQTNPGFNMFRGLDLTEEQRQQIVALYKQSRVDSKTYRHQLLPLHQQMMALKGSPSFDEAAVRAIATQEAQINIELNVIRARTESASYNVLTAEQKAKLEEFRKNRRGPGKGMMPRRLPG